MTSPPRVPLLGAVCAAAILALLGGDAARAGKFAAAPTSALLPGAPEASSCIGTRWRDPGAAVSVGAIRWDAWFAGSSYERSLDDPAWRDRIPFYGLVLTPNLVQVDSNSQAVMDQEIAYASQAGLTYWAFDYYHPRAFDDADAFNYGLRLYLSSACRSEINFALLLQGNWVGPAAEWAATAATLAELFQQPTYQTVAGGRPLLYILGASAMQHAFGSWAGARFAMDALRAAASTAGVPAPYIVGLGSPRETAAEAAFLGLDAIGAYSAQGSGSPQGLPYAELRHANETFWSSAEATGQKVVPPVSTGWDPRPRMTGAHAGGQTTGWYQAPTPAEFGDHIRRALEWTQQRPAAEARTILVYAWNEHDEGGWLTPTLTEGPARLTVLEQALRALSQSGASAPAAGPIMHHGHH